MIPRACLELTQSSFAREMVQTLFPIISREPQACHSIKATNERYIFEYLILPVFFLISATCLFANKL